MEENYGISLVKNNDYFTDIARKQGKYRVQLMDIKFTCCYCKCLKQNSGISFSFDASSFPNFGKSSDLIFLKSAYCLSLVESTLCP